MRTKTYRSLRPGFSHYVIEIPLTYNFQYCIKIQADPSLHSGMNVVTTLFRAQRNPNQVFLLKPKTYFFQSSKCFHTIVPYGLFLKVKQLSNHNYRYKPINSLFIEIRDSKHLLGDSKGYFALLSKNDVTPSTRFLIFETFCAVLQFICLTNWPPMFTIIYNQCFIKIVRNVFIKIY